MGSDAPGVSLSPKNTTKLEEVHRQGNEDRDKERAALIKKMLPGGVESLNIPQDLGSPMQLSPGQRPNTEQAYNDMPPPTPTARRSNYGSAGK